MKSKIMVGLGSFALGAVIGIGPMIHPVQERPLPCGSDLECVTMHPEIIPDGYTIRAYRLAYGDEIHFPTKGDCARVDWLSEDEDGQPFVPVDLDGDGKINCDSDLELGS